MCGDRNGAHDVNWSNDHCNNSLSLCAMSKPNQYVKGEMVL